MPLIKKGAVALGKGALVSGQSIKIVTDAGKNLLSGLLTPGMRPRKRVKRATAKKGVTTDEAAQETDARET